jgi:hypothetical protein
MGGRSSKDKEAQGRVLDVEAQELQRMAPKELARRLEEIMEHRRLSQQMVTHQNIQARRSAYARSASQPVSCLYSVFCSCWSMGHKFSWVVQDIIDGIQAGESEKLQLWEYYVKMVEQYDEEARRAGWWLTHLQFLRTTFNIVLPAILALQNLGSLSAIIMWLTWGLSLIVSLSTGYIDLFRLQSRYEMLRRSSEYLKIEGWQFFGLIGRYSSYKDNPNQHQAALHLFLYRIAKIKKRILDMEFPPKNDAQDSPYTLPPNHSSAASPSPGPNPSQPTSVGPSKAWDTEDISEDISALMKGPAFRESSAFRESKSLHAQGNRRSIASHLSHISQISRGSKRPTDHRPNTPDKRSQSSLSCPVRPVSQPLYVHSPSVLVPAIRPLPLTPAELNREALDTEDGEFDDEAIRM